MKYKTYQLICIGILIFIMLGPYGILQAEPKYAGSFLELGIGARAMAMGGAFVSIADDGSAFYWNPAGASQLIRSELFGMYASLFKSLEKHHHIGFTQPIYGGAAISLNWIRLSVSDIPRYDSENWDLGYSNRVNEASTSASNWQQLKELGIVLTEDPLGYSNFTSDAFVVTLAKSYNIDLDFGWQYFIFPIQIPVGINVKFIRQSLFNQTSSGLGFDAGTMLKFGIDDLLDDNRLGKLSLALGVKDLLNTKLTWNTQTRTAANIKRSWHLGLSYFQPVTRVDSKLLFAYAYEKKYDVIHHFGVEYIYHDRLALRFGLDQQQFTAGIGLQVLIFTFDYAYKGHELGGSHRISTSVRF